VFSIAIYSFAALLRPPVPFAATSFCS